MPQFRIQRPNFLPTKDYLCNHVVNTLPLLAMRMAAYRALGVDIGFETTILMSTEMHECRSLKIGRNTVINQHCLLDGRGGLIIGNNVNVSSHVLLVAGRHDINHGEGFRGSVAPIVIEDYVWLCTRATVLAGITIGRGAVVAAGAVVTRSVEAHAIVAGVPAKKIGERNPNLTYNLVYPVSWQ